MSRDRNVRVWAVAILFLGGAALTAAEREGPTTWRANPDPASWSLDWTPSEDFSPVDVVDNQILVSSPNLGLLLSNLDLQVDLGGLVEGLDGLLGGLEGALDTEVFGLNFPLIGGALADAANVIVDERGEPRVLDFGVARAIDPDLRVDTLQTEAGQLVGTLAYMSPEQSAGDPTQLDSQTDVYSLGVIAFELFAGRLPYDIDGRPVLEALQSIKALAEAESLYLAIATKYNLAQLHLATATGQGL